MSKLIILSGIPGCGKSTYCRNYMAKEKETVYIVSSDRLRMEICGTLDDYRYEKQVWTMMDNLTATYAINTRATVFYDATTLYNARRIALSQKFRAIFDEIELVVFDFSPDLIWQRNISRLGKENVPQDAWEKMKNKFELPDRSLLEYFDKIIFLDENGKEKYSY